MSSLLNYLKELATWLIDALLWLPVKLWEIVSDALATVIESIPVPAWLAAGDPFAFLPDSVAYFMAAFLVPEGLAILIGASTIRFLIRRLPIVG